MTGEEIIQILINTEEYGPDHIAEGDIDWAELDLPTPKYIEHVSETNGHAHVVMYFEELDVYIKLTGWYSSYSADCEFEEEDYAVVKPAEKTITVYE